MRTDTGRSSAIFYLPVVIATALVVQLIGRYHAGALMIGQSFYLSWILLRIVLPVIVLLILGIPLTHIGIGMPSIDRKTGIAIILIVILLPVVFLWIYFVKGYFNFYSGSFRSGSGAGRFLQFMIFTSSTLTGWEFLHRGFLLFGIIYLLTEREGLPAAAASLTAVCLVWAFEVLFHFIKPELEAAGMLIGSPVLSWLALRTRSIWIPLLIHFIVEVLFILSLILR